MSFRVCAVLWAAVLACPGVGAEEAFPPPKSLGDVSSYGRNVQRTMRLLATSTFEKPNTVRVLFYGQSITEQGWWKRVAEDLRKRFPNARLVIENRAIGGHSSQLLVKTAEADVASFEPDLVVFHVYGDHQRYEDIIRGIRERTTAEVLIQNDHVIRPQDLEEETDAAKLPPAGKHWDAFMNHNWLPQVARRYQAELCDQRAIWKQYLKDYGLAPSALLSDAVHLNARGEFLMAECVKAYLRYDPKLGPSPAEGWVKTFRVGKDVAWKDGKLRLEFDGGRVTAVCRPGAAPPAEVRVDGKKASETDACYTFTRTSPFPGMNWPCLLRVGSQAPRVAEDWTLTLRDVSADGTKCRFSLRGSETGEDGEGESGQRFVSRSGRVVIEPGDWNLAYAMKVRPQKIADGFRVTWRSLPLGTDTLVFPWPEGPGGEAEVTLVQGLPPGRHVVEIVGPETVPVDALRVYTPPGGAGAKESR